MTQPNAHTFKQWKSSEKILFRIAFIYLMLQALPLDWKYYRNIFRADWTHLHYSTLFYIARYTPQIFSSNENGGWGLATLQDWAVILLLAVTGGLVWTYYDNKRKEYNDLYYLLRMVLRYRLAIAIVAYGFVKVFPLQLPYPSISLKNTNYGDFTDWKIAHLAYGIAPSFEVFLGLIEIFGGVLLLFRKSASIGAVIIIGMVGNVFLSNLGYNGGEAIYCLYLLIMATVIVLYDIQRWHKLIMLGKPTSPNTYMPLFYNGWKSTARLLMRGAFVLFLFTFYGYYAYALYKNGGYQYPTTKGLTNAAGFYNVREFKRNNVTLPYSLTDTVRWQNVVFENWATISIQSNKHLIPDIANTEEIFDDNEHWSFEATGSWSRQFYSYTFDSAKALLHLKNENRNYRNEELVLHFNRPTANQIILSGRNEKGDSIYVTLDRLKKIYLLDESYKIPQKRSVFDE